MILIDSVVLSKTVRMLKLNYKDGTKYTEFSQFILSDCLNAPTNDEFGSCKVILSIRTGRENSAPSIGDFWY